MNTIRKTFHNSIAHDSHAHILIDIDKYRSNAEHSQFQYRSAIFTAPSTVCLPACQCICTDVDWSIFGNDRETVCAHCAINSVRSEKYCVRNEHFAPHAKKKLTKNERISTLSWLFKANSVRTPHHEGIINTEPRHVAHMKIMNKYFFSRTVRHLAMWCYWNQPRWKNDVEIGNGRYAIYSFHAVRIVPATRTGSTCRSHLCGEIRAVFLFILCYYIFYWIRSTSRTPLPYRETESVGAI